MSYESRQHKPFATHILSKQGPITRGFTTEPKLRRLTWHRLTTVKARAAALQESFYPAKDVLYVAVKKRMTDLLGIMDRASVLGYLGRPSSSSRQHMDQEVRYASGAVVNKQHVIRHSLPARKGYIETLDLGYVYILNGEWWVHWSHSEQTQLSSVSNQGELSSSRQTSKVDFSLSPKAAAHNVAKDMETTENVVTGKKRESDSIRERNSESENIPQPKMNALERAILRMPMAKSKEP